jgi:hypothetical protein
MPLLRGGEGDGREVVKWSSHTVAGVSETAMTPVTSLITVMKN